jgi:hypothetical protein
MKFLLIILSFLAATGAFGQQISFRNHSVDTIKINSSTYRYHFDSAGTGTTTGDVIIIAFDSQQKRYLLSGNKRICDSFTLSPKTNSHSEQNLSNKRQRVIKTDLLDSLLRAFSKRYIKPTFENIKLDKKIVLKYSDSKHILSIIKHSHKEDIFYKWYSDKQERKELIKGCNNIDTFKSFLLTLDFDTSNYIVTSDYSDEMRVEIIAGSNKYLFEAKYSNFFKQPWYDVSDTTTTLYEATKLYKKDSSNFEFSYKPISQKKVYCILNFNINYCLAPILPKTFLRRESIDIEAITDQYIIWYLKKNYIF